MKSDKYILRSMTGEELEMTVEWAAKKGWNPGFHDADNQEIAASIFLDLRSKVKSTEPIFLDVPEVNKNAIALAEKYNMKISFETARMYTGEFPDLPLNRVYGVTSFEIG